MVISTVHSRTHQVSRAGVYTDIFLVSVLLMHRLGDQRTVGSQHKTSHLCIDRHITHACRHQDLLKLLANSLTDHANIVRSAVRLIRNAYAAGEIDECDLYI